ncbi:MAG: hypothetical protein BWY88_01040 [Synergistetes bacterium ADurb.Bin520]|nr:MAG: hypothetical protein BWY88_01040 [Synergistetes bacterium ADurb.Bin520]
MSGSVGVALSGESPGREWTERALARARYAVAPEAPVSVHVTLTTEGWRWVLGKSEENFPSLEGLLGRLAPREGPPRP